MTSPRLAEDLFRRSLAAIDVSTLMAQSISCDAEWMQLGTERFRWTEVRRVGLVAVGKAALAMSSALLKVLEPVGFAERIRGIVVSNSVPTEERNPLRYLVGGHPLPDEGSIFAATAVQEFVRQFGAGDLLIFLVSGGASSMMEQPLVSGMTLKEIKTLYRALVGSGLSIGQMNCVRKRISAVKGGRLAVAAEGATQMTLVISDVPGEDLGLVGSGPSLPDHCSRDEFSAVIQTTKLMDQLPASVRTFLQSPDLPDPPPPSHPAFANSAVNCLLSGRELAEVTRRLAEEQGYTVVIDNTPDDWDYRDAAAYLLERLRTLSQVHPRACLVSTGEVSVSLPKTVGVGGRNQQFALECAIQLHRQGLPATVLSAGTDGVDGNSPAAGGVVTYESYQQACAAGLNPEQAAMAFDAYPLLHALGASVVTGPTQNNVRDLRILLSHGA